MEHDFKLFPELTNSQMDEFYFESPHKQITEDFIAKVVKVHDGDTVSLRWTERDFDFPIRFINIAADELNTPDGKDSQQFLEQMLLNEEVDIKINSQNRVDKWGRLLGNVIHKGMDAGEISMTCGHARPWSQVKEQIPIPDFNKEMAKIWA